MKVVLEGDLFFKGTLTHAQIKFYSLFHARKNIFHMFVAVFFLFFIPWRSHFDKLSALLFFSFVGGVVFTLFFIGMMLYQTRTNFESESLLKLERRFIVNTKGINIQTDKSDTQYEWRDILSAYELKKMFILYVGKNKAIIIPQIFFLSQKEMESFKSFLIKNVSIEEKAIKPSFKYKIVATVNHLFALIPVPLINIALTLLYWLIFRKRSDYVNFHGKQSLNIQISFSLYAAILFLSWYSIKTFTEFSVFVPTVVITFVLLIYYILAVMVAIISTLLANRFDYPLTIKWIK